MKVKQVNMSKALRTLPDKNEHPRKGIIAFSSNPQSSLSPPSLASWHRFTASSHMIIQHLSMEYGRLLKEVCYPIRLPSGPLIFVPKYQMSGQSQASFELTIDTFSLLYNLIIFMESEHGKTLQKSIFNSSLPTCRLTLQFLHRRLWE